MGREKRGKVGVTENSENELIYLAIKKYVGSKIFMNKICTYCDQVETKDNPVKEHNGEMVCYSCRKDEIEEEYFPTKETKEITLDDIPF